MPAAVTIDALDRVLVAGSVERNASGDVDFAVARLNTNGSLDETFDFDGRAVVAFDLGGNNADHDADVKVDRRGRIVVGGTVQWTRQDSDFAAIRLNSNGSLDQSFGVGGRAVVSFDAGGGDEDFSEAIAIDASNRVVLVGAVERSSQGNYDIGIARLNAAGRLDRSFDFDGKKMIPFDLGGDRFDAATDVAIDRSGRIVVGGFAAVSSSGDIDFAVARVHKNGSLDRSFSGDGKQTIAFDRGGNLEECYESQICLADSIAQDQR